MIGLGLIWTGWGRPARAQGSGGALPALATRLAGMTGVTGYEQRVVDTLLRLLPGAVRDRAGNAVLRLGNGATRRLVVCPMDEPGYVVGGVRDDGYVTLRRVPGRVPPGFDRQLQGQRVTLLGGGGPVPGVVGVRSIHLTRGRDDAGDAQFTVDSAYVDVGAASRRDVSRLGVGVLTPVSLAKRPHRYGEDLLAAPVAARRAACAALAWAARAVSEEPDLLPRGEQVVVAFAVEEGLSQRGLATLAQVAGPFGRTLVVDGRAPSGNDSRAEDAGLAGRWPALGTVTRWTLGSRYPGTPVETVSLREAEGLGSRLRAWIGSSP